MIKTSNQELINATLPEIDDSTIKEIATLKLTDYPQTVETLKSTLKTGKTLLTQAKSIVQDELKLFTEREKQYTKLIEEMIDVYNNDYAKPNNLVYFGRNASTELVVSIHNKDHLPQELVDYIKTNEDSLIIEWYQNKYQNEKVVPLIEGIKTELVRTYKGVK